MRDLILTGESEIQWPTLNSRIPLTPTLSRWGPLHNCSARDPRCHPRITCGAGSERSRRVWVRGERRCCVTRGRFFAALRITMALSRPHEVMKMVSSPREGWQGTGRVGASAGGQGRVSNPPLRGLARVEVGTLPEAIFIAMTFSEVTQRFPVGEGVLQGSPTGLAMS